MKYRDLIKISLSGLMTHKSRSLLTILGIVIGITATVMVSALGQSAQNLINDELSGLGAATVVIRPGREPQGPNDFAEALLNDSLKKRELDAISNKANVPDLADISPELIVSGTVSRGGNVYRKAMVLGSLAEFMASSLKMELESGVSFDVYDDRAKANVALIGSKVKEELFGEEDAIGKTFEIKDRKFRVVGVYAPRGQAVFFNVDDVVIIPPSSAQAYLTGTDFYNEIIARANSPENVDRMVADIKRTLRDLHDIDDPKDDDFAVQTQQELVSQVSTIVGAFTIFLSFVVAISLVVGGIGIMNIMLVSVTERTREIGLRKAVGCTNKNILLQFLIEAVILTVCGGLLGMIIGLIFSATGITIARNFGGINLRFSFPYMGMIFGVGVSAAIGLVFGIFPARIASKKSPIEALRSE